MAIFNPKSPLAMNIVCMYICIRNLPLISSKFLTSMEIIKIKNEYKIALKNNF